MKRKIAYLLITAFIFLNAFVIYHFVDHYQEKKHTTALIGTLPAFTLQNTDGTDFNEKDLQKHSWTVFVFFNSDCHYCQSEAEQLKTIDSIPSNVQFIWVSSETQGTIDAFQKQYALEEIVFLHDSLDKTANAWGVSTIPQFLIYNPKGELYKNHKGAYKIENLISQIHDQTN